ncbi:MAG: RNA pseudouridine synthase [Succinivibrionaceae bacterium]|nr:RNA pseudouridine synthase [Succinivibrionaceae bacterium]
MLHHDDYNPPKEPFLDVIYEDPGVMVVNKPSGILSVPGKEPHLFDCILTRVQKKYPLAAAAHRLDMSTSGLLVVPKTRLAASILGKQFQARTVEKRYYAWVAGRVEKDQGEIDLPIALDTDNKPLQKIDFANGRRAVTQFFCLYRSDARSLMRLHPVTGRSHQLRLHMKELGHPILGDKWYATPEIRAMAPHLYLHAGELSFDNPADGRRMNFKAAPPFDIPDGIF